MNSKEQIKEKLLQEMQLTVGLVERYRELTKPIAPENAIGRISRMDAINNKAVNDVALVNAESKLKSLKIALSRIDDPDFGNCVRCKNPIPLGRILLLPHINTCVNCAL